MRHAENSRYFDVLPRTGEFQVSVNIYGLSEEGGLDDVEDSLNFG
jgi:hypothetical protein